MDCKACSADEEVGGPDPASSDMTGAIERTCDLAVTCQEVLLFGARPTVRRTRLRHEVRIGFMDFEVQNRRSEMWCWWMCW